MIDRRQFLGAAAAAALGADCLAQDTKDNEPKRQLRQRTKFAVNIEMWFRKLPFVQRIDRAKELGFPAVEFWPWRNKDLDAIAKKLEETGLKVTQFTAWGFRPGLNNPENHDRFVKEIEASCATAKKLGAKKMTVVGGNDQKGMTQAEMHGHIIDGLKRAAPIAERHNVMLILEPMNIRVDHKGHCLYGSPDAVRICEAVNSPMVKINWDLYHMQISEGDLTGRLRDGFKQVGYIQLADHPGRAQPGTGEIHYPYVLQKVHEFGYRGFVGLECWPKGGDKKAAEDVWRADRW